MRTTGTMDKNKLKDGEKELLMFMYGPTTVSFSGALSQILDHILATACVYAEEDTLQTVLSLDWKEGQDQTTVQRLSNDMVSAPSQDPRRSRQHCECLSVNPVQINKVHQAEIDRTSKPQGKIERLTGVVRK